MAIKESVMPVTEIADRLVTLCRKGQWETAQRELYADNAVSYEPQASPDFDQETRGLNAIIEKGHKFETMVEDVHKIETSEPVVAGSSFAVALRMDVTMKGRGRMDMTELCVYEVKDGKIVAERFFM